MYIIETRRKNASVFIMNTQDKHIEDLLFGHFTGELSDAGEKELLHWLNADESNKKYFSEMSDWWAMAHVPLFMSDMKADFEEHFGSLTSLDVSVAEKKRRHIGLWGKIAASLLLAVSIGTVSFYAGKRVQGNEKEQTAWVETITPLGSQSKVVLPDRSVVWVNAGSTLKYKLDFNKEVREVQLTGEAYFEVAKDSLRPFIVKSDKLDIRVMGTCFNVKAYDNENTANVALVSGKVNVHLRGKKAGTGDVVLMPDRMLTFDKETSRVKLSEIKGAAVYAWTNGWLEFDEQPFVQIAKDLERKFNVRIRIDSKSLQDQVFSGSFSSGHSLEDILREVDVEKKYTWHRNEDEFIIRNK